MQAIVLSRRDFREFDQMISLYTREQGKLELLARGLKKVTSKNAAHLEPFSVILIEVAEGKEIDHLTKVVPVEYFPGIRRDLTKSLAAGFAASFTDELIQVRERDERIFTALRTWLAFLESTPTVTITLVDGYVTVLLACLGFAPILEQCVICAKPLAAMTRETLADPQLTAGFYFQGGGVVCPACRRVKTQAGEEIRVVGLKEVSDMQLLMKGDWRSIAAFPLDEEERAALHKVVYEFILYHSERRIADWGFIESYKR